MRTLLKPALRTMQLGHGERQVIYVNEIVLLEKVPTIKMMYKAAPHTESNFVTVPNQQRVSLIFYSLEQPS